MKFADFYHAVHRVDYYNSSMSSDLEPKGESFRRALRWISEERQARPDADIKKIILEAGLRFDLPPLDQEFLWNKFVVNPQG
jgi:hypothetical protein